MTPVIDSYLMIFVLKNFLGRLVSPRSLRNRTILLTAKCNCLPVTAAAARSQVFS